MAFSPNGKVLVSRDHYRNILMWDVMTAQQLHRPLAAGEGNLRALGAKLSSEHAHFSPYQNPAIDVAIRELSDQRIINSTGNVNSMAVSPDSRTKALGLDDGRIVLWDDGVNQPLGPPLVGHKQFVIFLVFSPDNKMLASGSEESINLWDLRLESWQTLACRIANRNLTRAEWKQYFTGEPYRVICSQLPPG